MTPCPAGVRRSRADQQMSRDKQRVVGAVGGSLEDGGLASQVNGQRKERAPVYKRVLLEQDRRYQCLKRE